MDRKGRYIPLLLISAMQVGTGVLLYRHRVLMPDWQAGDWIVVYATPVAAFVVQVTTALAKFGAHKNLVQDSLVAAVTVAVSFLLTLVINLNLYGS